MRLLSLIFIFFVGLCLKSFGQVLVPSDNNKSIGKKILYLEDKSADLSLAQVLEMDRSGKFLQGTQEILNFGNTPSAYWLKIQYRNVYNPKPYLIVDAPNVEYLDCYINRQDTLVRLIKSGSLRRSAAGVSVRNSFTFNLSDRQDHPLYTIYLRVQTNNIMLLPIKLATTEAVVQGREWKDSIEYIYIGVLIALLMFNLFLYFSLGDNTYLYYALYVLTLSIYMLVYIRGYGFLFGDDLRVWFNRFPHTFLAASIILSIVFSRKILNVRAVIPKTIKFLNILATAGIVLFLVSILGYKSLAASISQVLATLTAVGLWVLGIMAYRKGHRPAKYYVMAWLFILVTVGIVTLTLADVLPSTEFTMQLVPIGSTLELLLLSFALGDRYKLIIRKERQLRDENLQLVKNQKQRLEYLVDQRTHMLSDSIKALEASNNVKNRLFSIISHDLRSPLNSLISILTLNDMDALTMEELQYMLKENKKNIEIVNNTLNNLLHWSKTQMEEIKAEPSCFDINESVRELILVYTPLIRDKELVLEVEMAEALQVFADENQVKLILRNLIDNAIKFTPRNEQIKMSLSAVDGLIEICVANTVADEAKINLPDLQGTQVVNATYGTENEKGVGLGLQLCREYIHGNGGDLEVSLDGSTICFSFALPCCQEALC